MPVIERSTYVPPPGLGNGHVQTIFPVLFRRAPWITQERERIATPDGDFLDLDWSPTRTTHGPNRLAILSHGLEGGSRNHYVQGMAAALERRGWDVLAWNCRGCSGEPNRLLRSYHSGATDDLKTVIDHALEMRPSARIGLVGFSLGGNIMLKYLGDAAGQVDPRIDRAVAFSVPCDLASSSARLESLANRIYMLRFLAGLRRKIRVKMKMFPGLLDDARLDAMRTFREFDDAYTAPLHGFRSAEDYWERASSKPVLTRIAILTLLVNARNDPFLAPPCFPVDAARTNPKFHLEMPESGGHLGFISFDAKSEYWSELRAVTFLNS